MYEGSLSGNDGPANVHSREFRNLNKSFSLSERENFYFLLFLTCVFPVDDRAETRNAEGRQGAFYEDYSRFPTFVRPRGNTIEVAASKRAAFSTVARVVKSRTIN